MSDVETIIDDFPYLEQQYLKSRNSCRYCGRPSKDTICITCDSGFEDYEQSRQEND